MNVDWKKWPDDKPPVDTLLFVWGRYATDHSDDDRRPVTATFDGKKFKPDWDDCGVIDLQNEFTTWYKDIYTDGVKWWAVVPKAPKGD